MNTVEKLLKIRQEIRQELANELYVYYRDLIPVGRTVGRTELLAKLEMTYNYPAESAAAPQEAHREHQRIQTEAD